MFFLLFPINFCWVNKTCIWSVPPLCPLKRNSIWSLSQQLKYLQLPRFRFKPTKQSDDGIFTSKGVLSSRIPSCRMKMLQSNSCSVVPATWMAGVTLTKVAPSSTRPWYPLPSVTKEMLDLTPNSNSSMPEKKIQKVVIFCLLLALKLGNYASRFFARFRMIFGPNQS